jgi:hypothetical protein
MQTKIALGQRFSLPKIGALRLSSVCPSLASDCVKTPSMLSVSARSLARSSISPFATSFWMTVASRVSFRAQSEESFLKLSRVESEFRLASRYKHARMRARSISLIAPIFRRLPTDRHVSFVIISSGIPGEPLQVLCPGPFVIVFELE